MPLIQIHLLAGRSPEDKRRLLESVTRAVQESIGAPLPSIRVWLSEMSPDEYMVAGELASERGAPPSGDGSPG
jgi:4-oxalocrotonate tautomerase